MSPHEPSGPGEHYPDGWAPAELPAPRHTARGDRTRWIIGAAVGAVVAVVAVVALTGQGTRPATSSASGNLPGSSAPLAAPSSADPETIASATDSGAVTIITDDITCGVWDNVQTSLTIARNAGWNERDPWLDASAWTPEQRVQFEAVGDALRTGAESAVALAGQTPHRVMRELYGVFTANGLAYSDALPNYQPTNDYLAQTSMAAADAITYICAANGSKVASVQEPALAKVAPPTHVANPANPVKFLAQSNPVCAQWIQDEVNLRANMEAWSALDPNIGVGQLDKEQVLTYDEAARVVTAHADAMEATGRRSGDPVLEDFATLGALYFRAYANAVPLIWAGDHDLAQAGFALNGLVTAGCQATV